MEFQAHLLPSVLLQLVKEYCDVDICTKCDALYLLSIGCLKCEPKQSFCFHIFTHTRMLYNCDHMYVMFDYDVRARIFENIFRGFTICARYRTRLASSYMTKYMTKPQRRRRRRCRNHT